MFSVSVRWNLHFNFSSLPIVWKLPLSSLMFAINNQLMPLVHQAAGDRDKITEKSNYIANTLKFFEKIRNQACLCYWFQTIYKSPHMDWTGMLWQNRNHDCDCDFCIFNAFRMSIFRLQIEWVREQNKQPNK